MPISRALAAMPRPCSAESVRNTGLNMATGLWFQKPASASCLGVRAVGVDADEIEAVAVVADDERDEDALQLDEAGKCLHVRVVERRDVLWDADPVERGLAPGLGSDGGRPARVCFGAHHAGEPVPRHPGTPRPGVGSR